jgi:hypothetical protein
VQTLGLLIMLTLLTMRFSMLRISNPCLDN